MSTPTSFTEKYRPRTLSEISGNEEVMKCLKSFSLDDLPNMLFYGPPGTGKTTAIRALLKDLPKQNILELNASDHRGIDTVRNEIKEFASVKMMNGIKVVILDEADSMSKDAQGALRRIIEDFNNTRFCFICNYYKKIIDPIVSRCSKFRFSPVDEPSRVKNILLKENIPFDEEGVSCLLEYSDGDMRKVMNDIQGIKSGYDRLSRSNVLKFFGMPDDDVIANIYQSLIKDSFDQSKDLIKKSDIECVDLIKKLSAILVKSNLNKKMEILKQMSDIEHRIALGCTDIVQVNALVGAFILNRS